MQSPQELFEKIATAYAGIDHLGSGSLLLAIRNFFESGMMDCAFALAAHGADIQSGSDTYDFIGKTWTEVYLETFRRAFYDEATAALYGTSFVLKDPNMLNIVTEGLLGDLSLKGQHPTVLLPINRTLQ